jgi:hypothetical protein
MLLFPSLGSYLYLFLFVGLYESGSSAFLVPRYQSVFQLISLEKRCLLKEFPNVSAAEGIIKRFDTPAQAQRPRCDDSLSDRQLLVRPRKPAVAWPKM